MKWILLIAILLVACQSGIIEPENKIPDSTMARIMMDMYALNAAFAETFGTVKDSISEVYIEQIENQYSVTREQLDENLNYLRSDPVKLDSMYSRILREIDKLETRISEN